MTPAAIAEGVGDQPVLVDIELTGENVADNERRVERIEDGDRSVGLLDHVLTNFEAFTAEAREAIALQEEDEIYNEKELIDLIEDGIYDDNRNQESAAFFPNFFIIGGPSYYKTKDDIVRGMYDVLLREVKYDLNSHGAFEDETCTADNPDSSMNLLFAMLFSQTESVQNLKHFTMKYIFYQTIQRFWGPLILISFFCGFAIIAIMLVMAKWFILNPIKQLLDITGLIMGKERDEKADAIQKDLNKLK